MASTKGGAPREILRSVERLRKLIASLKGLQRAGFIGAVSETSRAQSPLVFTQNALDAFECGAKEAACYEARGRPSDTVALEQAYALAREWCEREGSMPGARTAAFQSALRARLVAKGLRAPKDLRRLAGAGIETAKKVKNDETFRRDCKTVTTVRLMAQKRKPI